MPFVANQLQHFELWDYILGDPYQGLSLALDRYFYLEEINYEQTIKLALMDASTEKWYKRVEFPGPLWESREDSFGGLKYSRLTAAVDVHRNMLDNEIIIESDYMCEECQKLKKEKKDPVPGCPDCYELNYEAAKVIGPILEKIGFKPHYYYSGNKSIHIHIFFDWNCLSELDISIQDQLRIIFKDSKLRFKKRFMKWLRTRMINCWDTHAKEFDKELIVATHFIRCELSKNKAGFKTFLGYSHKDMSFIPYICNEKNKIYPKIGRIIPSSPKNIQKLMEDFLEEIRIKTKMEKIKKRNRSLGDWGLGTNSGGLKSCVKAILHEDFKKSGDGFKRGMFILLNELRRAFGDDQAKILIHDWNARMGFPVENKEIEYRFKSKNYSLSCNYIHKFLKECGIEVPKKC